MSYKKAVIKILDLTLDDLNFATDRVRELPDRTIEITPASLEERVLVARILGGVKRIIRKELSAK